MPRLAVMALVGLAERDLGSLTQALTLTLARALALALAPTQP